jgi:CRP-like cAMP-binding protein
MTNTFKEHLRKFIAVSDTEFSDILSFFQIKSVQKKENLLEEGEACRFHYFVLQGCLRKFFINEKGSEQTTDFAIESWWVTDNVAFECQKVSEFYIQAIESSEVLVIDDDAQEKLLSHHPKMERYFRLVYQRAYAASQRRMKFIYSFSREELYYHFRESFPEFVQRVPQYLIASYLGFTPEYLSEIRSRRRS